MQPFGNQNQVAAAMEYIKRRALADAIARGITIPQLGGADPRLPESMSAGGAAPPFWPGMQPQAQPMPQGGQPMQQPVPPVEIPQGAVSGATIEPTMPRGRLARVMQVLQNPQFAAMLGSAGQALGGPRLAGESQMQQISRAMAAGVGGAQGEQQHRMQMQQAAWQRGMEERKQGTAEAATQAEIERGKKQVDINELQVKENAAAAKASLMQRKVEATQETAHRQEIASIQRMIATGNIDEGEKRLRILQGQLDAENRKLTELEEQGATQRGMAPRTAAMHEMQSRAAYLQGAAALKRAEVAAKEQKADPIVKMKIDMAGRILAARYGIAGGTLEAKVGGPEGAATAAAAPGAEIKKILSEVDTIVDSITKAKPSGPQKGDKQAFNGADYEFDGTQWVKK